MQFDSARCHGYKSEVQGSPYICGHTKPDSSPASKIADPVSGLKEAHDSRKNPERYSRHRQCTNLSQLALSLLKALTARENLRQHRLAGCGGGLHEKWRVSRQKADAGQTHKTPPAHRLRF